MLLLSCPVRWCGSCPTHPIAVLASTAVMSCTVPRQVCGVQVVSVCLCCSCGGVSSVRSPLTLVEGGAITVGGVAWWMVGGMVSEGRVCCWPPRLVCGVPRLCVGVPLVVYPVALLNGGSGVRCVALSSDWVGHLALSCSLSYCSATLLSLCLLSQHCWFSVVSLWQGCVIVEWR